MTKRTITAEDVQRFQWLSNPALSPNGQWVVYEKMVADEKEDGYETHLVLAGTDGHVIRTLTSSGTSNTFATWSPDGKFIAFVSNRAYGSQLWVLPMDGGEARQVTRFRYGFSSPEWSPDGKTLFGLVPVARDQELAVFPAGVSAKEAKEETEKENKDWANDPKLYDWLYHKNDGVGFQTDRREQLVAVDVESGDARQLTSGNHDVSSPAVSPDGKYIAFTSNRKDNPDVDWWYSDVYRVPVAGGDLELLSSDLIAYSIEYDPTGRYLAVLGHGEEHDTYWSATHLHLFVIPAAGGKAEKLTAAFPDTLGDVCLTDMRGGARGVGPVWSKDGQFIYTQSTREGRCEVVRFSVDSDGSDAKVVIGGNRDVYGFAFDGRSHFVISYSTPTHPGRVVCVDTEGGVTGKRSFRGVTSAMDQTPVAFYPDREVRLDNCNDELLAELDLVTPEPFWYTSDNGWQVQGWVMRPAQFEEGKKYPVILEIHGGPQMNYGYAMFHEMQWLAAQGYAIVYTNPRGGTSYGQEFANAVRHNYGNGDAADVMNGLDAAIAQFDFLDGSRVAVTGGSYGGFMTNWLVGHTNRFFAAVSQRSISNWISFYGVSDIGPLFVESQHGYDDVTKDFEGLWKISPLAYVNNVKTPLLLIHSEHDYRCPIEQAEQFFTCIRRQGGEAELFRVPNASHGLSRGGKPKLRIARLNALFNFIHKRLPNA